MVDIHWYHRAKFRLVPPRFAAGNCVENGEISEEKIAHIKDEFASDFWREIEKIDTEVEVNKICMLLGIVVRLENRGCDFC
ncbi:MAG: hypothetical protein GY820_06235 [Gammaproteobacteria bacterium]|nr:hypothetical protein [Gammaproteobacteria bacterium]